MTVEYEILVLLRHYWKANFTAIKATEKICQIEGSDSVNERTARRWFKRFNDGDTSLQRIDGSGRPQEVHNDLVKETIEADPTLSSRKLAEKMEISQSSAIRHLHIIGKNKRRSGEIPHILTEQQVQKRLDMCRKLLENPLDDRFWRQIVTTDEKWIYFKNPYRGKQWLSLGEIKKPVPKHSNFDEKVMITVFWNYEGVIWFDFLDKGKTMDSDFYCEQLDHMHDVMKQKYYSLYNRKSIKLQHDNARPHVSLKVKNKLAEMDAIEVLCHPPYSPDLAPSDYYLFRSMAHFLVGRDFNTSEELRKGVQEFFDSKPKEWYREGILQLAKRWFKVVDNNGLYFDF